MVASAPADETDTPEFRLLPSFAEVLELGFERIAVDMPIGLPAAGDQRTCDTLARKRLGRRASCVFPAPPRDLLYAAVYEEVRYRGLSLQSFYLLPKIRELDALLNPQLQQQVFETHPELVFLRLNGGVPLVSKKTEEGLNLRKELLGLGPLPNYPRKQCLPDDLVDSAALLRAVLDWGCQPNRLPEIPATDARGLRMEICF